MTNMNPADDGTHEVGSEPNWNESMYVQFHDPNAGLGGFLRLAKRPNEGRGERTVCLYLPDGSVAFGYSRPSVSAGGAFEGAGLLVEVLEPFEHLRVSFGGAVNLLPEPAALVDPKAALSSTAVTGCAVALDLRAVTPPYAESFDGAGQSFAPNHYEQLMAVSGVLTLGETSTDINGFGLRDHSWGPRSWQAPHFYRWVHGSSREVGFMGAYFGDPDGADRFGGFVWDGGALHRCEEVEVSTERDVDSAPRSVTVTLTAPQRRWTFHGEAKAVVPLRHRRGDSDSATDATRIAEAAMVWKAEDGTTLHGMAEYLDQVYDGELAGLRI
ncbi:DUF7065 domain-containing protein [Mycolicibacterium komossense]|uniref:Uncharacterized protein n=1 Tax=Mycolicibacterium komossense TaxID=1779 RepID=A0ABT3CAE7_9MYCO|nr:hypothetical protein [Mycolicibacterium komossense]MCV7226462.1 hypothetical protein [Mycolicibacterium komossense]